jgi:transcriptional regulator with XRE-family HTH domain
MAQAARPYSRLTREATRLLGRRIAVARRERRWTIQELAERVGVSHVTMSKVERGDLSVSLGVAFEAAVILGIPLFDESPERRQLEQERIDNRLAVLPQRVRRRQKVDDDF